MNHPVFIFCWLESCIVTWDGCWQCLLNRGTYLNRLVKQSLKIPKIERVKRKRKDLSCIGWLHFEGLLCPWLTILDSTMFSMADAPVSSPHLRARAFLSISLFLPPSLPHQELSLTHFYILVLICLGHSRPEVKALEDWRCKWTSGKERIKKAREGKGDDFGPCNRRERHGQQWSPRRFTDDLNWVWPSGLKWHWQKGTLVFRFKWRGDSLKMGASDKKNFIMHPTWQG